MEWAIQKVCTITVDNVSSNDVAILSLRRKLTKRYDIVWWCVLSIRCFADILNL